MKEILAGIISLPKPKNLICFVVWTHNLTDKELSDITTKNDAFYDWVISLSEEDYTMADRIHEALRNNHER